MKCYELENLTFSYPESREPALKTLSLQVRAGEFLLLCGRSGSGKSTLLRQLRSDLTPEGRRTGVLCFDGRPLEQLSEEEQRQRIGCVQQDPESGITALCAADQLCAGMERLSWDPSRIRRCLAEIVGYFGMQTWLRHPIHTLSGGQRQLLQLAAAMILQPDVLILDEPTAQLDPIAAESFFETLVRINRETATTVILSEQRLETVFPLADRILVLDEGRIPVRGTPREAGLILGRMRHPMREALPAPMRIYLDLEGSCAGPAVKPDAVSNAGTDGGMNSAAAGCPVTVQEGRRWLQQRVRRRKPAQNTLPEDAPRSKEAAVSLRDVWFRYSREDADVIRGLSLQVPKAALTCVAGGNGTGKSTMLKLIYGRHAPYRGRLSVLGRTRKAGKQEAGVRQQMGWLPQDPQTLLTAGTLARQLEQAWIGRRPAAGEGNAAAWKEEYIRLTVGQMELTGLLDQPPASLSGGEKQRAALACLLLQDPEILLLDEPTKGMDGQFKKKFALLLRQLVQRGKTILMVSHDIEFCAGCADHCVLFFDGAVVAENGPRRFFTGNSFYTTAANRMARQFFQNAVTEEDVVRLAAAETEAKEGCIGNNLDFDKNVASQ